MRTHHEPGMTVMTRESTTRGRSTSAAVRARPALKRPRVVARSRACQYRSSDPAEPGAPCCQRAIQSGDHWSAAVGGGQFPKLQTAATPPVPPFFQAGHASSILVTSSIPRPTKQGKPSCELWNSRGSRPGPCSAVHVLFRPWLLHLEDLTETRRDLAGPLVRRVLVMSAAAIVECPCDASAHA